MSVLSHFNKTEQQKNHENSADDQNLRQQLVVDLFLDRYGDPLCVDVLALCVRHCRERMRRINRGAIAKVDVEHFRLSLTRRFNLCTVPEYAYKFAKCSASITCR